MKKLREQHNSSAALKPRLSILVKLGSIAVHVDEMLGPGGHNFDRIALQQLLNDPEIKAWIADMGGYLPVKR